MSKTLLLADDSVTIQRVIELTFAHEDVRVIAFSDGRRALQYLDTELPDIVLVDVGVPEVDGYSVASRMKRSPRLKQVPVLLLAASGAVDEVKARNAGCEGVLVKPFEPQQLVSRVKELLAKSSSTSGGGRSLTTTSSDPFGDPGSEPEPLEPPARPVWEQSAAPVTLEPPARPVWEQPGQSPRVTDPAPAGKVSLANAFSALLAAEQSKQPSVGAPASPAITEAGVEELVRRVLARMSAEDVRKIVIETTERLVKEEIEKIKASPE